MFHIAIDEPAQLAIARWLSGGTRWNLFDHSTWRPGMGTLLTPLFWFTDDTVWIMRGGLLLAAALGGAGAVVLARLAWRITPLSPLACVAVAGAAGLAPASLSASAYVWAEPLVTLTFLGTLSLLIDHVDTDRDGSAFGAIVVSVLGAVAHGRLVPLVVLVAIALVGRALWRRAWRRAATYTAVTVGWMVLGTLYVGWVFDRVWDDPGGNNTVGAVFRRLPDVVENLRSAVGQSWYLVLATAGTAAIGIAVALWAAVRGRSHVVRADHARVVLLLTVPLVGVSVVFMSGRSRVDQHVYGRYNDAIVWPLVVIGVAWLLTARGALRPARWAAAMAVVAGVMVTTSVAVEAWWGDEFAEGVGIRPMTAGFAPVIGVDDRIPVLRIAVAAVVAFLLLAGLALLPRRGTLLTIAAAAFLVVAGVRTHDSLNTRLNSWQPATEVAAIAELVPPGAVLGVKFVPDAEDPRLDQADQRRRIQMYQFALPDHLVVRDRGVDDDVGPFVFAPLGDDELTDAGATLVWKDPVVAYGLWREPASPGGSASS